MRNELARDSYSYLHFPMVAGIVLAALGLKTTLGHVGDPLAPSRLRAARRRVRSTCSGSWRSASATCTPSTGSGSALAILLFALLPVATNIPALATLAIVTAVLAAMIAFETSSYGEGRGRVRHEDFVPEPRRLAVG